MIRIKNVLVKCSKLFNKLSYKKENYQKDATVDKNVSIYIGWLFIPCQKFELGLYSVNSRIIEI
jgi:hypothetical protein